MPHAEQKRLYAEQKMPAHKDYLPNLLKPVVCLFTWHLPTRDSRQLSSLTVLAKHIDLKLTYMHLIAVKSSSLK